MKFPLVGIAMRPESREGVPPRLLINRAYCAAIEAAGGTVLPLPPVDEQRLRGLYDRCDAICLPGGADVQPSLYGETEVPGCGVSSNGELDAVETRLARWALGDDRPVLAICRGMQVLNVVLGGTLWQDLAAQRGGSVTHRDQGPRDELLHTIEVSGRSRLRDIAGSDSVEVNSLHHQGVRILAEDLTPTAHAPDGLVEAVEHRSRRYVLGIQCHPEELFGAHPWARRLFADFIATASE